jgi:protein AATF/BFR2
MAGNIMRLLGTFSLIYSYFLCIILTTNRKGKLRKSEELNLGKEYEGLSVSRDALDNDGSDDDPFGKGASDLEGEDEDEDEDDYDNPDDVDVALQDDNIEDEDIDSDGAFGESDDDLRMRFRFLGSSRKVVNGKGDVEVASDVDGDSGLEDYEESDAEYARDDTAPSGMDVDIRRDRNLQGDEDAGLEEEEDDDDDEEDHEDSEDSAQSDASSESTPPENDRATLRKLMASDQKIVAATISQAAKADATKGQAVKRQRATFDSILSTRIKLQKSLMAMNSLPTAITEHLRGTEAMEAAENAAMTLWSTIEDLRQDLAKVQAPDAAKLGKKRKRPGVTANSTDVWSHMQYNETTFLPQRQAVLEKWSSKVRAATATDVRGKLLPNATQQGITAVLDAQLTTEADKLVQRTKVPRSGAPVQAQPQNKSESGMVENSTVFDDTDFYQLLLRELVEQRMDSSNIQGGAIPIATSLRATRVKKSVDTKASKGRKIRYTVHEKLQNFMAPEDRGTWTEKARDEFFGSLLGARAGKALREEDEDSEGDGQEGEALRLFRT